MAKDVVKKKKKSSEVATDLKVEKGSGKYRAAVKFESLSLRYRPKLLSDLIGQEHIATEIMGMLKLNRFPQTILINGESGCGKTTTARMIARYIHCRHPDKKDYTPCGECISCKYEKDHPDVHELNMAEQRGIDDVRSLIQSSRSMPTIGDNRIFIIDEIHAMTTQAAQAFLKPLEEPPSRTMWILCTTNPEKLPTTVLGRCHKFNVGQIPPEKLVGRLARISKREGVDIKEREGGPQMLKLMADLANGRMRDAITLLEKAIFAISSGQEFDSKTLMKTFLTTADSDLDKASATLLAAILAGDLKGMLKAVRVTNNPRGLLNKMRWLLMYLLDSAIGEAKYAPYNAKLFSKMASTNGLKVNLNKIVRLQYLLLEMESRFNSMSVDENVVMLSMFGNEIAISKPASEK